MRTLGIAVLLALLATGTAAPRDDYPGEEVPGTRTPIALGDVVFGSPQRGHITFKPRANGGPTPWNCLAHAKGHTGVWIQPGDGARSKPGGQVVQVATMQQILGDNACAVVACADPPETTMCPAPAQLVWLVYGLPKGAAPPAADQLPDDDYWLHAMRRTPEGWTSKDGTRERRDRISDPYRVLDFYTGGREEERTVLRCACCPLSGLVTTTTTAGTATTSTTSTGTNTSTTGTLTTTTSMGSPGTSATSTSVTTTSMPSTPREPRAVRLDHTLSASLPAGTEVCLNRIKGGYVAALHVTRCRGEHLHSPGEIGILVQVGGTQEGPFPDPDPAACGYGLIVLNPACPPG